MRACNSRLICDFDYLQYVFCILCSVQASTPAMKRLPPPIYNSFQAYLRCLLSSDSAPIAQRRNVCSSCLRSSQRVATRHCSTITRRPRDRGIGRQKSVLRPTQQQCRGLATVLDREDYGPLKEYNERIHSGKLRNDDHQRSLLQLMKCRSIY